MGGKSSWFAALATRVLLLLGVAYVSLWWSYQQFYGVFGVAPDDVGLTPSGGGLGDIIGAILRLGLWLSLTLIVLALLPVGVIGAAMYAIERRRDEGAALPALAALSSGQSTALHRLPRKIRIEAWGGPVLALVLLGVVAAFYYWLDKWIYVGVLVGVVLVVALVWLALSSPITGDERTPYTTRWFGARQWWLLRALDVFIIVAVVGVLFIDLPSDAREVAVRLLDRANTRRACKVSAIAAPVNSFELDLLAIHAFPAKFAVDRLPKGLPKRRPFSGIYLGTANGWLVIYRKGTRKTPGQVLRVPTSAGVAMRVEGALKGCHGVHGPGEQGS